MERNLVKKSSAIMLMCCLSLLLVLTSACQETKLKAVIEIANKQCPMDMGQAGKITSIVYDGTNVVYNFNINEALTDIKVLNSNPESMKDALQTMFQNPSKEIKELLDLMVKCNAGLQMNFIGSKSGEQATCEITTDELKEIFSGDMDESKSAVAKLEAQLKIANLQFPMDAGQGIVVEKIEMADDAVVYKCKVDEEVCEIDQIEASAEVVKQGIVESLNTPDQSIQLFIKSCTDCDKNVTYSYISKQTGKNYDIVITVDELKKMLKK